MTVKTIRRDVFERYIVFGMKKVLKSIEVCSVRAPEGSRRAVAGSPSSPPARGTRRTVYSVRLCFV